MYKTKIWKGKKRRIRIGAKEGARNAACEGDMEGGE
jgi:hypothetical protein